MAIFVLLRRWSVKEELMNSKRMLMTAAGCLGAVALLAQAPAQAPAPGGVPPVPAAAAPQQGPGVQAAADSRYAEWVGSKCKTPPPTRGGGGGRGPVAGGPGGAAGGPPRGNAVAAAAAAEPARGNAPNAAPAGGPPRGNAPGAAATNGPPQPRDYTVNAIPGVIAAGQ